LRGADLTGAVLNAANLTGADLEDANLSEACLRAAGSNELNERDHDRQIDALVTRPMEPVVGLRQEQLDLAYGKNTKLPDGFSITPEPDPIRKQEARARLDKELLPLRVVYSDSGEENAT
jgi:Pentapeptide repeats (8 copies)